MRHRTSLGNCASSISLLMPHCGLMVSWSTGRCLAASSTRRRRKSAAPPLSTWSSQVGASRNVLPRSSAVIADDLYRFVLRTVRIPRCRLRRGQDASVRLTTAVAVHVADDRRLWRDSLIVLAGDRHQEDGPRSDRLHLRRLVCSHLFLLLVPALLRPRTGLLAQPPVPSANSQESFTKADKIGAGIRRHSSVSLSRIVHRRSLQPSIAGPASSLTALVLRFCARLLKYLSRSRPRGESSRIW